MRLCLPDSVTAEPEQQHANDTRADIVIASGRFQLPIEVKRDDNPSLWEAVDDQLIAKYTGNPAADGHGIYLVLWFRDKKRRIKRSPDGIRPADPAELKGLL